VGLVNSRDFSSTSSKPPRWPPGLPQVRPYNRGCSFCSASQDLEQQFGDTLPTKDEIDSEKEQLQPGARQAADALG
jgi:hypothetical protein